MTNAGHNPIRVAGRVFPPRRTVDVRLKPGELAAVQAHRRLMIESKAEKPSDG